MRKGPKVPATPPAPQKGMSQAQHNMIHSLMEMPSGKSKKKK